MKLVTIMEISPWAFLCHPFVLMYICTLTFVHVSIKNFNQSINQNQGQRRTLYLSRQRFYWHCMEGDVKEHVRCCHRFVFTKSPEPEGRAPLESITTSRPLELVCIDLWSAEASSNKSLDVLVVTDHFTKLA